MWFYVYLALGFWMTFSTIATFVCFTTHASEFDKDEASSKSATSEEVKETEGKESDKALHEEKLAAQDAKVEDLCNFLQFLLAQDYLLPDLPTTSRKETMPKDINLRYGSWLNLNVPWSNIHETLHLDLSLTPKSRHYWEYKTYLVEPAKVMGVKPQDVMARVQLVPLCEHWNMFSLISLYTTGKFFNAAKKRVDIDEAWIDLAFRNRHRDSLQERLYERIKMAHAILKSKSNNSQLLPTNAKYVASIKNDESTSRLTEIETAAKKILGRTKIAHLEAELHQAERESSQTHKALIRAKKELFQAQEELFQPLTTLLLSLANHLQVQENKTIPGAGGITPRIAKTQPVPGRL
ncbi:hypothetical protein MMC17_006826 [Xylographa soralifera]|nr:hypothetical protein [Xylographa soralifera]